MKKLLSLLMLSILTATSSAQNIAIDTTSGFKLFDSSGEVPYRIPAIGTTKRGTLIAVADYRHCKSDIGFGRIDLHVRTSKDGGKTWGEELAPASMTGNGIMADGNQKAGYGDPCIVCDRHSRRIMLMSCSGYPCFFNGTREQHQGWARWYSEDEGQTWTGPEYIDEQFIFAPFDKSRYGSIVGWFVGSGKIHQSRYVKVGRYYRLYLAGSSYNNKETANWVLYSDDFGANWHFLGGNDVSPVPGGDEPKVEELPNGNIVISSRTREGRNFNIFSFTDARQAQGTWAERCALSSRANNGLIANNGCNGEIQILPVLRIADKQKTWIALQSLPTHNRTNVSIFYKEIGHEADYSTPSAFAREWTLGIQTTATTSAYSTLTLQRDNTIGFLYEENLHNSGYDIIYKNYTVQQITAGKYRIR